MVSRLYYIFRKFKQYFVLSFLLIISLLFMSFNDSSGMMSLRAFSFGIFAGTTEFIGRFITPSRVYMENAELRLKNAELMIEVNKFREAALENSEIKNLLGMKDSVQHQLIFASVVYRAFSTTQSSIVINSGAVSGIKSGMPVIGNGGFIGIIHSVDDNFSVVRTLKDINFRLVVKEEASRYNGILRWNGSTLQVTNLPKTSEISVGDRIISSEISSLIPIPLTIGTVSRIINPDKGIMTDIEVMPAVNLERAEYVFVVNVIKSNTVKSPDSVIEGVNE